MHILLLLIFSIFDPKVGKIPVLFGLNLNFQLAMSTQQDSTLRRKVVAQTKIAFLWFIGRHPKRVKPVPDVVRTLYILVSSFCSMAAINAVLKFGPVFKSRNSPLLAPWVCFNVCEYFFESIIYIY